MPDDYGRKPYTDKGYRDWIRSMPAKAIWNQITERYPGVGEFAHSLLSTPLSRSIQRYIQQSEFKKPYLDEDFVNMEQNWEGPGNGTRYRPGKYDIPWNMQYPQIGEITDQDGFSIIFDAETDGCFCPGEMREIVITTTHPCNGLTLTYHDVGTTMVITAGLGTNAVTVELTAAAGQSGYVTIEASMQAYIGPGKTVHGDSNVNVWECSLAKCCEGVDCDAFIVDADTTPDTIAQDSSITVGVTGGTAPFTWVLTQPDGSGFSIDASITATTTLYTAVDACGSAVLTVTDVCDCEVEFGVRCTTGHWVDDGVGKDKCTGCGGAPYCSDSRGSGWSAPSPTSDKDCYPPNCQYYFTEYIRRSVTNGESFRVDVYDDAEAECEAARAAATCSVSNCTFFGTSGMECEECVAHPDPWGTFQSGGSPVVDFRIQTPPGLYTPNACVLNPGSPDRYAYGWQCWPSQSLRRWKWDCA